MPPLPRPAPRTRPVTRARALVCTGLLLLGGCRPAGPAASGGGGTRPAAAPGEADYVAPPGIVGVSMRDDKTSVAGLAPPGWTVRLSAPEGDSFAARARRDGSWTLVLPALRRARMFAVSAEAEGRVVHAEGALILAPPPFPALLARAGSGALSLGRGSPSLSIDAVDYDAGGFAAISGRAPPRTTTTVSIDGVPAGVAQAGPQGRYAVLAANRPLGFGVHTAVVRTGGASVERTFDLTRPAPLEAPYTATAEPGDWRLEWATPGGGVQVTLALASPGGPPVRPAGSG